MSRILSKTKTGGHVSRPLTAVELTPEGALAGTIATAGQPPVYAFTALPAGAVLPGIGEPNLRSPEAVSAALRSVLDQVGPRNRNITLMIPDTSVRVFMLDFDTLPTKPAEIIPVLRFRLRKMVPFEVEHAAVSYQLMARSEERAEEKAPVKVLVAVMPGAILAEFETAVRDAGYEPGAVLPSSLAALAALDSMEAMLAVNLGSRSLTTSITSGEELLLYRTVDLPDDDAGRLAEVQRSVAVAAAYFEDRLSAPPRKLHYAGAVPVNEFARAISDAELEVIEIAPFPSTGATSAVGPIGFAGITGALAGVA